MTLVFIAGIKESFHFSWGGGGGPGTPPRHICRPGHQTLPVALGQVLRPGRDRRAAGLQFSNAEAHETRKVFLEPRILWIWLQDLGGAPPSFDISQRIKIHKKGLLTLSNRPLGAEKWHSKRVVCVCALDKTVSWTPKPFKMPINKKGGEKNGDPNKSVPWRGTLEQGRGTLYECRWNKHGVPWWGTHRAMQRYAWILVIILTIRFYSLKHIHMSN